MHHGTQASAPTPPDRRSQLGAAIRRARRPRSQTELAELLACPQSTISMWENGHVKLSAEQVNRVELALDLPAGQLLSEAGYLDPDFCPRSACSAEPSRSSVRWRPASGTAASFPERVNVWLEEFRPLIDSICVLRGNAYDDHALHALLSSHPVEALQLGWEFWEALAAEDNDSEQQMASVIGGQTYRACRYALWGESTVPDAANVVQLRA